MRRALAHEVQRLTRRAPCRCRIRLRSAPGKAHLRTARSAGAASRRARFCPAARFRAARRASASCICSARLSSCLSASGSHGLCTKSTAPSVRAWRAFVSSLCPDSTTIFMPGRMRDQLGHEPETFVGAVRRGRQPEVDQRELRRAVELAQQAFDLGAGVGDVDGEIAAEHEIERVGDQRIVVYDQQVRFVLIWQARSPKRPKHTRLLCQIRERCTMLFMRRSSRRCTRGTPARGRSRCDSR